MMECHSCKECSWKFFHDDLTNKKIARLKSLANIFFSNFRKLSSNCILRLFLIISYQHPNLAPFLTKKPPSLTNSSILFNIETQKPRTADSDNNIFKWFLGTFYHLSLLLSFSKTHPMILKPLNLWIMFQYCSLFR